MAAFSAVSRNCCLKIDRGGKMFFQVVMLIGIVQLMSPAEPAVEADTATRSMPRTAERLSRVSAELRDIENALRVHAALELPVSADQRLNEDIALLRGQLIATAEEIHWLTEQTDVRAREARRGTLKQQDMRELLGSSAEIANQSRRWAAASAMRRPIPVDQRGPQTDAFGQSVKNERLAAQSAFNHWQETADQLDELIKEVMKTVEALGKLGVAGSDWPPP